MSGGVTSLAQTGAVRHDPRRGAILMLISCALFVVMGALVKALSERLPWPEIMFFRCVTGIPLILALSMRRGRPNLLTRRFRQHLGRACTGLMAMSCSFFALTVLPLAEQTALSYTTPVFVTILAIPFLGERPGPARWVAVGAGFCGIMIIALGQGAFLGGEARDALYLLGFIAAVSQGVFAAVTTMLVRSLSATEASATIVLWQSLLMSALTAIALPFVWVAPQPSDVLLLIGLGVFGGMGQWLLTEAWASAQVSAVAPFSYTALLWAALAGWLVWGEMPGLWTWVGAALIVVAGLAMLRVEMRGSRRTT